MKRLTTETFTERSHHVHKNKYIYDLVEYTGNRDKVVLERDNYTCQKCGSVDELHCHHIDPVANNPIESADVDNCITYCVECHKKAHKKIGCRYTDLQNC